MTLKNKYDSTELHCQQKERVPYENALIGRFCQLITTCAEFILTAFLIKVGQMVEVLSNVFITRPHTTNGYLLEQGLVQVSSK